MRKRANPAVIGGFVVGAGALIVIGVLLFGRGRFLTERRTYVLSFDDSVEGLSVGAPVNFQGARIGSVTGHPGALPSPSVRPLGRSRQSLRSTGH